MTKLILHILVLIITLSKNTYSQNANLVIQVNEKLVTSPLYCSITFDSINGKRFNVWYIPGELLLDTSIWNEINRDSTKSFWFHFYRFDKLKTTPYFIELTGRHLKKNYLILNVYDFDNKKYKRWYQWFTDRNFLVELGFDGSGKYIKH